MAFFFRLNMIIGIDPGWASFGLATVDENGCYRAGFSDEPRRLGTYDFLDEMWDKAHHFSIPGTEIDTWKTDLKYKITDAYIERYVSYGGVTTDPEMILMFIGALKYFLEDRGVNVHMVRAIDWKPKVCKYLVRTKGFNNPFPSFDKKYSVLAAQELSGITCGVNHEADAICLAYLKRIDDYNASKSKK